MRVFRGISANNVVIWATLLAAVPGWLAIAMSFQNPVLAWIGYVWTCVFFALAWIALFWPRVEDFRSWLERFLSVVGGPVTIGLLLGGMEWLISNSLRNALWIGLPGFALAQIGFAVYMTRLTLSRKQVQELTDKNEQLDQLNKNLHAERDQLSDLLQETKRENAKLKAERDELKAGERRKRIEEWRSAITNHEFGGYPRFASTVAYSQMKPHLRLKVVEMLEAPRTLHVGNEARGDTAYRYTLLDEVARIEKEWGLV